MRNEERQPPPSPPSLTVDFSGQLLLPRASPPPPPPPGPADAQLPSVTLAFSSEEEARRAGAEAAREFTATETETPREIDGKVENLLESTDPAFAAAFVNSLGADGLWRIVRDGEQPEAALAAILTNAGDRLNPAVLDGLFRSPHWKTMAPLVLSFLAQNPVLARSALLGRPDLLERVTDMMAGGGWRAELASSVLVQALVVEAGTAAARERSGEALQRIVEQVDDQTLSAEGRRGLARLLTGHMDAVALAAYGDLETEGRAPQPGFDANRKELLHALTEICKDTAARAEVMAGASALLGTWADDVARGLASRVGQGATDAEMSRIIGEVLADRAVNQKGVEAGSVFRLLGEANEEALGDRLEATRHTVRALRLVVSGAVGVVGAIAAPAGAAAVAAGGAAGAVGTAADLLLEDFEDERTEAAQADAEAVNAALQEAASDVVVVSLYNAFSPEQRAALGIPAPPLALLDADGHLHIPMGDPVAHDNYRIWLTSRGNPIDMWKDKALQGGFLSPFMEGLVGGAK